MRIGFDVDGVAADFHYGFSKVARGQGYTGLPASTAEQKEWKFDLPSSAVDNVWREIDDTYNWWMTLPPLQGFDAEDINECIDEGDSLYFLSNRKSTKGLPAQAQTRHWLTSIGILADRCTIICDIGGGKGELVKALELNSFIEDKPDNMIDIHNKSPHTLVIARAWEYNKDVPFDRTVWVGHYLDFVYRYWKK